MELEDIKHVAGFAGLMAAGMCCVYIFVRLMAIAAIIDGVSR